MAFNGSGSYSAPASSFPAVSGAVIDSTKYNTVVNDIASALSTCVTKDGQSTITSNQPMSGYKHTGVANAAARTDYAALGQVQDSTSTWGGTAAGTANAITFTLTPAIAAYAAGQSFTYKSGASANTTAMTANVNAVGAKAIQKNGAALASGDHPANSWFRITYDGAAFQLEQLAGTSADVTAALALKANLASPTLTGTPLSTTAAVDTNTTQVATTAFVLAQAGSATPLVDAATAVVGTSTRFARADHVHPGVGLAASQAQVEAASSNVVTITPANMQYHPAMPKAWVAFDGKTGATATILSDYNVASVTRNSAGNYTVNFTTPFSSTAYGVTGFSEDDSGGSGTWPSRWAIDTRSVSAFQTRVVNEVGTAVDCAYVCFSFFGDW